MDLDKLARDTTPDLAELYRRWMSADDEAQAVLRRYGGGSDEFADAVDRTGEAKQAYRAAERAAEVRK